MQIEDLADKLNTHLARDSARFEQISKKLDALSGQKDSPQHSTGEKSMSEVRNVFEPGFGANNGNNAGWGAGVGGLIGAAIGNGGLFGGNGNRETATLDQVDSRFNSLQGQLQSEALQGQIGRLQGEVGRTAADSTIALGAGIASVKDAVISGQSQTNLGLCNLGHTVQAGFAQLGQTVLLEGARTRELAQQTEINRLLALTAQQHSDAGHARTQVMISQIAKT